MLEAAALPVLLYLGRNRWFRYDEWDFLSARSATSLHDLFEPHSVHWSTLPILLYRGLWAVFGLHTYVPYQLAAVLSHLAVAALIRVVMRRAGVRPWTATAAVVLLILLGSGDENILWAFGVTFTAALMFGLVQLLLADHDGDVDRRDQWALVAGLAALLCSGVAVTMVIVVGLAVLMRRGWRAAAFHTVPLAAAYGIWLLAIGRDGLRPGLNDEKSSVFSFMRTSVAAAFGRASQIPGFGWVLLVLLLGGCFLAWRGQSAPELRRRASAPLALLIGAFLFLLIASSGRGTTVARASRYTYVVVALLLPATAVAADAVMRRWRVASVLLGVWLAVAVVGNARLFDNAAQRQVDAFQGAYRESFFLLPRLPLAGQIPRDLHPDVGLAPWVTFGWLEDNVESGRIPAPKGVSPQAAATAELTLALRRQHGPRPATCRQRATPTSVRLQKGATIRMTGTPLEVQYIDPAGTRSTKVQYASNSFAKNLLAYAGPLNLRISSGAVHRAFQVCAPPPHASSSGG